MGWTRPKAQTFDLVLTDQNMPNMDGLALIRALRGLPSYARVPILMLTTESSDEMKAKGRAAGATGWLVKPFDPQRLTEVVKKVILGYDPAANATNAPLLRRNLRE